MLGTAISDRYSLENLLRFVSDLVLERDDGQVLAVEVKAGSRISGEDFRGLRQLKGRLGPQLEEAIILHTGEHAYTHDDWIMCW